MRKLLLLLALAGSSQAAAVWTIGGRAVTPTPGGCTFTTWGGDAVLHNTTDSPVVIRLTNYSDITSIPFVTPSFTIAPHATTSLQVQRGLSRLPSPETAIWIDQLDVPDGVAIEGRIEVGAAVCNVSPPIFGPVNGKLTTPTFRSLAEANSVQRHLGTDLGIVESRINVGVFNGGPATAHARIEVRRACDDKLLASTNVNVNQNSVQQVSLNPGAPAATCPASSEAFYWVNHTTVVVDQPSISLVSTISNNVTQPVGPIFVPYSVSQ